MNKYEFLLILKDESSYQLIKEKYFKKFSVKVEKQDLWGVRKFAYPIEKQDSGYYTILNISIEDENIPLLMKELELEDSVLRSLIFKD